MIRELPADRGTALHAALQGFDDRLTEDLVLRLIEDRQQQAPAQECGAL